MDAGETNLNCPQDIAHAATCISPCTQAIPFESTAGIRTAYDFTGTTTWSTSGLPSGWNFAGAPTATTAGALPAADGYGAKAGLIQPNCSGSCTGTNGFCIGNLGNVVVSGGGGTGGKLGANFDGRANVNVNASYAVLRGQNNPTLESEAFDFSGVEGFKIQFWLFPSETSCGQSNSWGSCTGNVAYLDFSSNGGTSWTQVLQMDLSTSTSDMCFNNSTNTKWLTENAWSRVCLTVFKSTTSPGNFYTAASATTAASGIMVSSAYFTANFKFRIRYSQSFSCTSGITTTNPGRYLAIDYPVITSGNQMIPCGISFINMCGYGTDNNDDGVGSSTLTTNPIVFGTVRRGVNQSERGVEIFHSQSSAFTFQNSSGSNFITDFDLCNAEGGDKQCIDWRTSISAYSVVYECLADWEAPTNTGISLQYYKSGAAQSQGMTKVTNIGKTATIGWRYSANLNVSCGFSNLNPGCNGYAFLSGSLPTQFARGFYRLGINSSGQSWSAYGASSCMHYFSGPSVGPLTSIDTMPSGSFLTCSGSNVVFTSLASFCTSTATVSVTGPNGFSDNFASNQAGTVYVTDTGEYQLTPVLPASPEQCIDCVLPTCIRVTSANLGQCLVLPVQLHAFSAACRDGQVELHWQTASESDHAYFEVQRSADAIEFYTLKQLPGQTGNTSAIRDYMYSDENPLPGRAYYRLKQVDLNGKTLFSPVRHVDCTGGETSSLQLYPNPVESMMQVNWPELSEGRYSLDIHNTAGIIVQHKQHEWISGAIVQSLDLSTLDPGLYFLLVRDEKGGVVVRRRFVVQ